MDVSNETTNILPTLFVFVLYNSLLDVFKRIYKCTRFCIKGTELLYILNFQPPIYYFLLQLVRNFRLKINIVYCDR